MPKPARIPAGRSGRLWLRRRLATATAGRDQLDRKLRILVPERQRLLTQAQRRHEAWQAACQQARTWLLRAVVIGGEDAVASAVPVALARVELTWTTAMGLRYPVDAALVAPEPASLVPGNSAVLATAAAYHDAVVAGARTAAADEALRRIDAEIAVTRRRLRALEKRWVPWLEESLAALELALEQAEQDDGTRLRRAVAARPERRSP
ncbi:MAG TPA: V-type ATP synthase subunit D [Actinomycetes bacterium]|nr:V-type ATP synthase subunit D [Actinomycetes bacterium]